MTKDNNGSTVELIHYLHIDAETMQIGVCIIHEELMERQRKHQTGGVFKN